MNLHLWNIGDAMSALEVHCGYATKQGPLSYWNKPFQSQQYGCPYESSFDVEKRVELRCTIVWQLDG